jgi:hypothetical protein
MIEMFVSLGALLSPPIRTSACESSTYAISGHITDRVAEQFTKHVGACGAPETILVRSPGGSSEAAIVIGEVIADNKIRVEVDSYCYSACALFIALPAYKLVLDPEDIVGFHHSLFVLRDAFQYTMPYSKVDWDRMNRSAEAELAFFRKYDLDQRWLVYPMKKIGASCIYEGQNLRGATPGYRSRYAAWEPDHEKFRNFEANRGEKSAGKRLRKNIETVYGGSIDEQKPFVFMFQTCPDE